MTKALPAYGHAREVELQLPVQLDGGRQRLSIHIDGGSSDSGFLLLTGWFVDEDADSPPEPEVLLLDSAWDCDPAVGIHEVIVDVPHGGPYVLQLLWRHNCRSDGSPLVNGGGTSHVRSSGPGDVRYLVDLRDGPNRIGPPAKSDAARWMAAIEHVAIWPTRETLADAAPDGLLETATGFLAREPADLSSLLPEPFNRAIAQRNILWLASSIAAERHFIVRVRNRVAGQTITIRLGGEIVGTAALKQRVAEATTVHCQGRFDRGFNPISIEPSVIGKDEIDRDLAFYMEDVAFSQPIEPADQISWDDSDGFGLLEAPVIEQGLPEPFRWMEEPDATIVVDRLHAGLAVLTLKARFLGPRQHVVVRLNGDEIAATTVEGLVLRDERSITAAVAFRQGRNEIALSVDAPGVVRRDGRDLYMLLERLDIGIDE